MISVAQTLVGINVRLDALTQRDSGAPPALLQKVARTHKLVEQSVETIHRFARELRPTMLDDLGLIPALRAYLKKFMDDTGIRASFKVFAGIEQASCPVRTTLFRVAQEALTNVSRHARASLVSVSIEKSGRSIRMKITDDGQGFNMDNPFSPGKNNGLGLLGMRERVEMIGGNFRVDSTIGRFTTVHVNIPLAAGRGKLPAKKRTKPIPPI